MFAALAKRILPALALLASTAALGQANPPAPPPSGEVTLPYGSDDSDCNGEIGCIARRGDRRSDVELIWDGDGALLRERLAETARLRWPSDPLVAQEYVEAEYARIEVEALDLALGGQQSGAYGAGGWNIPNRAAPFVAQLRYGDKVTPAILPGLANSQVFGAMWQARHRCGGTLIAREWVLTAAHCIDPDQIATGIAVQLGVTDISTPQGYQVEVDGVVVHAGFGRPDMYHDDIALLHLNARQAAAVPPSVAPAAVLRSAPPFGMLVSAVGWGRLSNAPRAEINASAHLARVDMFLLDNATCAKLPDYGPVRVELANGQAVIRQRVHANVVCVYGRGMKTCSGDSGGPLFQAPKAGQVPRLVGLVSWNKAGCDITSDDRPGVYTRVLPYLGWIERAKKIAPRNRTVVKLK